MRPLMRYPVTSSWEAFQDGFWSESFRHRQGAYRAAHGACGACGEYDGLLHARCWWRWLTEERTICGYHDGEQQIEPDEPYPSRLRIAWYAVLSWVDPRYWYWRAVGMLPWPTWVYRLKRRLT